MDLLNPEAPFASYLQNFYRTVPSVFLALRVKSSFWMFQKPVTRPKATHNKVKSSFVVPPSRRDTTSVPI